MFVLYNIIVAPIEAIVGWIFLFIINKLPSLGVIGAICGVSVAINILALPLYNIAESIQEKEREINKKLEPRVKQIKKAFKGDEQFMMLSEYYRQNSYHPLYALRGSLSILIEIPFFIAAYNYLSNSEILKESSFWIFNNLGEADRMFTLSLGSLVIPINILPIIMTAINFVSGYIYTRNATKRDKIQLYAMGLFFLVLLYNSPSGLVIYWILNNIFSLVKTIVLKTKHPGYVLHAFISLVLIAFAYKFHNATNQWKYLFVLIVTVLFVSFPFLSFTWKKYSKKHEIKLSISNTLDVRSYFSVVLFSGLGLAFLCGFLIPAQTIASSPIEFSFLGSISNPSSYVWSTLWFYIGLFVFWPIVVYKMFGDKVKRGEALILFSLLAVALFDTFVFKSDYGTIDAQFFVENAEKLQNFSRLDMIGPFIVGFVAVLIFLVFDFIGKISIVSVLSLSIVITEIITGAVSLNSINTFFKSYSKEYSEEEVTESSIYGDIESVFHLSKDGKNVIVLFLDRAIGSFLPYALEQVPELEEQLRGFVYYPNTLSYSNNTITASPAMAAGYEYTPENMNKRDGLLREIHNEALLVAPTLFNNAGYTTTVTDPPFPNYSWRGDLSKFENTGINAFDLYGNYSKRFLNEIGANETEDESLETKEEAINFSMLLILPPMFRFTFEEYCRTYSDSDYYYFVNSYSSLYYFNELTDFSESGNTYMFISNETPHQPVFLDDDYSKLTDKKNAVEIVYPTENDSVYTHFVVFSVAFKRVGIWLDYLRENGVYDNTRIVIVSDHGGNIELNELPGYKTKYTPLLLFKDFNSNDELKTDNTFMTNADTILLSTTGLEEIPQINPFTGNVLTSDKENGITVYPIHSDEINALAMKKKTEFTLTKDIAYHVSDDIYDESNWIPLLEWEEMSK